MSQTRGTLPTMSDISVKIEHREEGYLLHVVIPRSTIASLNEPGDTGLWDEPLPEGVSLAGYEARDGEEPEIVRVLLDIEGD